MKREDLLLIIYKNLYLAIPEATYTLIYFSHLNQESIFPLNQLKWDFWSLVSKISLIKTSFEFDAQKWEPLVIFLFCLNICFIFQQAFLNENT